MHKSDYYVQQARTEQVKEPDTGRERIRTDIARVGGVVCWRSISWRSISRRSFGWRSISRGNVRRRSFISRRGDFRLSVDRNPNRRARIIIIGLARTQKNHRGRVIVNTKQQRTVSSAAAVVPLHRKSALRLGVEGRHSVLALNREPVSDAATKDHRSRVHDSTVSKLQRYKICIRSPDDELVVAGVPPPMQVGALSSWIARRAPFVRKAYVAVIPSQEDSVEVEFAVPFTVSAIGEEGRRCVHSRARLDVEIIIGVAAIIVYLPI